MSELVPFAHWLPVQNHGGPMTAHLGLVMHVQEGNGSLYGWFDNPASQVSATWWISKDGTLEQYVDADTQAWAQAAGNPTWNSCEFEGFPTEALTDAQLAMGARLYEWGVTTYGWPKQLSEATTTPGFAWHGMGGVAWGNHPDCPGDIRKPQRASILGLIPAPGPGASYPGNMIARNTVGQGYWAVRGVVPAGAGCVYAYNGAPDIGPSPANIAAWGIATAANPIVGLVDDGAGGFVLEVDANQYPGQPALYHITANGAYK